MEALPLATTSDDYSPACTLVDASAHRVKYKVANASVIAQLMPVNPHGGQTAWGPEFPITPEDNAFEDCCGIRFKSAVAGQPARVAALSFAEGDPIGGGGVPNTLLLAANGSVSNPFLPMPGLTVTRQASPQSIPSAAETAIVFDTLESNLQGGTSSFAWSAGTDVQVLASGLYLVTGFLVMAGGAGTNILISGHNVTTSSIFSRDHNIASLAEATCSTVVPANANDVLRMYAFQDSGAPLNLTFARLGIARLA